jgi:hypothetical protein
MFGLSAILKFENFNEFNVCIIAESLIDSARSLNEIARGRISKARSVIFASFGLITLPFEEQ